MTRLVVAAFLVAACLLPGLTEADGAAKVLIIGAGMTGTLAGKTLHQAGETDFIIIESASRVGGRMWHVPFGGITVELGAMYMHGGGPNNPVFARAQELDMDFVFPRPFYTVRNHLGEDVTDAADELYETLDPALTAMEDYGYHLLCDRTDKADASVRNVLNQFGWNPKTDLEMALTFFETEWDVSQFIDGCSTRHYYEFGKKEDFNPIDYIMRDSRGYAYIVESFIDEFITEGDGRLRLSEHISTISQNDSHVTVTTTSGASYTGEYLLSTMSLGVLQAGDVTFDPPFDEDKTEAIGQHRMTTYMQVYLQFPEQFWDDDQWIVHSSPRWRHWPVFINYNTLHPGSNIIQACTVGEEATRVEQLSYDEAREEVMAVLRDMYGPDIPEPTSVLIPRWGDFRNFKGSYSDWPVGYSTEQHQALRKPHGRIHFAGEAMSSRYFGYVHGAYYEGIRGAEALMRCMDEGDCDIPIPDECNGPSP